MIEVVMYCWLTLDFASFERGESIQNAEITRRATKARFNVTQLALDHPERGLDLLTYLRFGLFYLALSFIQDAALAQYLV